MQRLGAMPNEQMNGHGQACLHDARKLIHELTPLLVVDSVLWELPHIQHGDPEALLLGMALIAETFLVRVSQVMVQVEMDTLAVDAALEQARELARACIKDLRPSAHVRPHIVSPEPLAPLVELAQLQIVAGRLHAGLAAILEAFRRGGDLPAA